MLGTSKRMIKSEFEDVDKLIAILEACQVECELDSSFNWAAEDFDTSKEENIKARALSKFADDHWVFRITADNKEHFLQTVAETLDDGDICHYIIKVGNKQIAKGYDSFVINFLDPDYFNLTENMHMRLGDSDVYLKKEIEKY